MRKLIVSLIIIAILGGSFIIMNLLSADNESKEIAKPKISKKYVQAIPVLYRDTVTYITASGRVNAQNDFNLSSEVQGKILAGAVPLKKGQSFKQGDLLLRIYSEEAALALKARKSRFLTLLANLLPDLKIDFPEEYAKWLDFFDHVQLNSKLPDLPKINDQKEKVFLAGKSLISEYYGIESDELRLAKYKLFAPFSGAYAEVYAEVGAIANPGANLARLSSTQSLEIEIPVFVEEANLIEIGNSVALFEQNQEAQKWTATIVRKAAYVDPASQSITIYAQVVPEKGKAIYKGQYLNARIAGKMVQAVMEIPRSAVVNSNQVYVILKGKLARKDIEVLKVYDESILFRGLEEGIYVITEALVNPVEGNEVELLQSSAK
jgi:membrane fusion protein, multidrug efflux system